jgi:hypothetical protein
VQLLENYAGELNGESNLLFTGSELTVSSSRIRMSLGAGASNPLIADSTGDYGITWNQSGGYLGLVHAGSFKLYITSSAITIYEDINMILNKLYFDSDATNTYIAANTSDPEDLEIHADQDLLLMADNAVGIKTTTPAYDLDVSGSIGLTGSINPAIGAGTSFAWNSRNDISQPISSFRIGTAISQTRTEIYNLKSSGWVIADCAGASDSTGLLGMSLSTATSNYFMNEGLILIPATSIGGTYALGAPLYLDPSNTGGMTFTAPTSGTGVIVRAVGFAVGTNTISSVTYRNIMFKPSNDFIEL